MDRRKFIIGVGALGAGTSAALSTGAFTNVEAQRSMTVSTAGDQSAYLRLMAADSPNGRQYASYTQDGTLSVTLDQLNENAVTTVESLFTVQNEGSQTVSIYLEDSSDAVSFEVDGDSIEGAGGAVRLSTGQSATVDVTVDTTGDVGGELLSDVTVMAKSQVFSTADDNVVTVGPAGSGADELTIEAGLAAAASEGADAVLLYTGEYTESVTVAQDGLTLEAAENASPVVASPDGEGSTLSIDASGVSVEGLILENELGAGASHQGISLATGASDLQIVGNTIRNVGTAADASGNAEGIAGLGGHSGLDIVNNTFENIHSSYDTDRDWFTAKAVYLTSNPSGSAGASEPVTDVRIRNNTVLGVTSDVAAYGVQIQDDVSNVEIADNTISGVSGDAGNDYTAEVANWGDNYDWASAINLGQGTPTGPSDVFVHDNVLSADSHAGGDLTPGFGVVLEGDTDTASVRVRQNDIQATGGVINKTGNGAVDAHGNWWGAADGPGGYDADAGTATTVDSAGSAVADGSGAYVVDTDGDGTAEVNFDEYLAEPVFSRSYTVAQDGSAQYETVEAAISAARPGDDVLLVDDATYSFAEDLVLDKPVFLTSTTESSPTIDLSQGGSIVLQAAADLQNLTIAGEYSGTGLEGDSSNLAISVRQGSSGSVIANNDISGFYGGIQTLSNTSGVHLHGNTVSDVAFGIATQGGNDTITENTVHSDIQSIATWKADGVTIRNNTVTVDSTGLADGQHWGGDAPGRGIEIGGENVTVTGNDVTAIADRDVVFYLSRSEATNTKSALTEDNSYEGTPVFVDGGK